MEQAAEGPSVSAPSVPHFSLAAQPNLTTLIAQIWYY